MLPWTAPSTLPRSGSHGVLAHQQRAGQLGIAGEVTDLYPYSCLYIGAFLCASGSGLPLPILLY